MIRHLPLLALILTGCGGSPTAIESPQSMVERFREAWSVPGVAVVILDGDREQIILSGVRDAAEPGVPVDAETLFPIASCTKAFTAQCAADLVAQRKLQFDDAVVEYLHDFRLADAEWTRHLTIRDILSHRSGLAPHDLLWYRSPLSQRELVERLAFLEPSAPLRKRMQYQTILYLVAGQLLETVSRTHWESLVRSSIAEPLGMRRFVTRYPQALADANHAGGHRVAADGAAERSPWYKMPEPNAAGSICLDAESLAKWLRFQLAEASPQTRELHREQISIPMEGLNAREHPETTRMGYGMGWMVQDYRGERQVSHGGIVDGFRAHLTLLPDRRIAVGVLANLHATRMNLALANQLVDHLLAQRGKFKGEARDWSAHYQGLIREQEAEAALQEKLIAEAKADGPPPKFPLERYAGVYDEPAYGRVTIRSEAGKLVWEWGSYRCELEPIRGEQFRILDPFLKFAFVEFDLPRVRCLERTFTKVE